MTNDFTANGVQGAARPACAMDGRGERGEVRAISVNAGKVLETTRRAWSEAAGKSGAVEAPTRRPPRVIATEEARGAAAFRAGRALVAALNYWSPKPL